MRISPLPLFLLLIALLPLNVLAHGGAKKMAEAIGIVHQIDSENNTLNITTEPIKKLGWSETTMDWEMAEGVKIDHLNTGDRVKFLLKQTHNNLTYHIINITTINQRR